MVLIRRLVVAGLLAAVPIGSASAWVGPVRGNDLGGIIVWSPYAQRHARAIAAGFCARYGRVARITSIWPRYGQYIGFGCWLPKAYYVRGHRRARVVLHARD